jgi:Fe-S cluster biogenesis protein NfuA
MTSPGLQSGVVAEVEATVRETLMPLLRVHGGGVELLDVSEGTARLRFTDACTACRLRPLTMAAAIRPRLLQIDGVEEVEIEGVRLSRAALKRFERLGGDRYALAERQRNQAKKARYQ